MPGRAGGRVCRCDAARRWEVESFVVSKPWLELYCTFFPISKMREVWFRSVAKTGGHIGPNLGVVELTIAMHYVFDTPTDHFVFDVSHQAYVHKLLTGREPVSYDSAGGRAERLHAADGERA